MDWISIGTRIRAQRESLGYSREFLAEKLDITPKFCSDIELGLKGMSVSTLCRISQVLMLSTDYILFGTEDENEVSGLTQMIARCPRKKVPFLEQIVKQFIFSFEDEI